MSAYVQPPAERDVDPTTRPWRALEGPTDEGPSEAEHGLSLLPTIVKIGAVIVAVVACASIAVLLAVGGVGGDVIVDASGAPAASGPAPTGANAGARADGGVVVVEVVGAVRRPGIFRLPAGSRIGDLIAAAGGYGPRVDTSRAQADLNLAATLHDGDHVRVPSRNEAGASGAPPGSSPGPESSGGGATPIDLNTATAAELEALPGIGPATSAKIIAARAEAPFVTVDDLRSRGVIGQKVLEKIRALVTIR